MTTSESDRQAHQVKSTLVRKAGTVKDCANGTVVFDGIQNAAKALFPWSHKGFKGINAAKRYIRKSGAVSYSV